MLKNFLAGAAVIALSGHAAMASNVIINGVPHQGSGPVNISYGANGGACCVEDLPYTPLPVISTQVAPATATVVHEAAPIITHQAAPVVTHQAAPVVTHQSAPIITHQAAAPAVGQHEIIINQLPAPAPIIAEPVVAAPVVAAAAPAAGGWSSRVYVGARGGVSFLEETDFRVMGIDVENEYRDPAYTISAVAGWSAKVRNDIQYRLEAELGYQFAEVDTHEALGVRSPSSESNGDTETLYGFANAYLDIPVVSRLNATIGGGIGVGYVKFDEHGTDGLGTLVDDSDTAFGYHLDAGLSYDVTDQLAVEALYRYQSFVDVGLTAEDGTESETDVDSHNVLVGARYGF